MVEELQFISHSVSGPVKRDFANSCLRKHGCVIDGYIISDLVKYVCETKPINSVSEADGHLAAIYKRKQFF